MGLVSWFPCRMRFRILLWTRVFFVMFTCFMFLAPGLTAFKWNQAWHSSEAIGAYRERKVILKWRRSKSFNGVRTFFKIETTYIPIFTPAFTVDWNDTQQCFWAGGLLYLRPPVAVWHSTLLSCFCVYLAFILFPINRQRGTTPATKRTYPGKTKMKKYGYRH